jgi:hypothetical protein
MPEDTKEERQGTSWARATRELRQLRHRIEAIGGIKDQWEALVWHMDKEQWDLLWTGEQEGFLEGGASSPCCRVQHSRTANGTQKADHWATIQDPTANAAQEGERTQIMRILLSRGVGENIFLRPPGRGWVWFP